VAFKAVTACKQHRELLKAIAQALINLRSPGNGDAHFHLAIRFISERNVNQQKIVAFTAHAVESFDKLLLPLEHKRDVILPLVGTSCANAHLSLRKQAASLQTVRQSAWSKTVYCTARVFLVIGMCPSSNCSPHYRRQTSHDAFHRSVALKNSPVMIMWYPAATDGQSGIIEVVNIDLLTNLMLEPDEPLITSASLSMNDRHLSMVAASVTSAGAE
jgi:hypothetical protein